MPARSIVSLQCSVSADSMCESQMNMAALLKARSQGGVGGCDISSDCLALQCAGLQSYVLYSIGTRLLPCQTPFGVSVRVVARGITFINVVITQTTVFQFVNTVGVTATVRIEVEQKPFGITISVSLCAHTHCQLLLDTASSSGSQGTRASHFTWGAVSHRFL
jgi:hypothetical protein